MDNNIHENIYFNSILNHSSTINASDDDCIFQKHDWLEAKFYLTAVCGSAVAVFGMVANFLTVCVLTRPSMRSANNLFLTALALFDICVLVSAVALYAVEYVAEMTDNAPLYGAWVSYISAGYALSNTAQTGSTYVTVAVTIERYIAVVHHKRREWMCGTRGAGTSIFWVFCFSVVYNLPKFFEIETYVNENCTGLARYGLKESPLQSDDLYSMVYSLWITQMVMVFVPFFVLLFFNSVIALKIRRTWKHMNSRDDGRKRSELKEKSREVTYVLIVIVLLFLVCNSWGLIMTVMERFYGVAYLRLTVPAFYTFSREAVNFLTIVNSSANFIIYCIFGKEFRRQLMAINSCFQCLFCFIPCPTEDTYSARHLVLSLYHHRNSSTASSPLRKYSLWLQRNKKRKFRIKNSQETSNCPVYSNDNLDFYIQDYILVKPSYSERTVSTCLVENQANNNAILSIEAGKEKSRWSSADGDFQSEKRTFDTNNIPSSAITNNGSIGGTVLVRQQISNDDCTIVKFLSDKHDSWV